MRRTNTYKLENFESGSFYFASSDYRRFVTLDYNLKKYIGIVGNGVLRGWDIEVLSGTTIKIKPGCGFISGLYAESPWTIDSVTKQPKRKNKAISDGDDIFEEIPGWSSASPSDWVGAFYKTGGSSPYDGLVFDQLGPDGEDNNFDGNVDGVLQPHYKEPPDNYFNNPFVKAVPKSIATFTLPDNTDTYIFAKKTNTNAYDVFVDFFTSSTDVSDEDNLLLGIAIARNGSINAINYNNVLRAKSIESSSKEITQRLLQQHVHGGSNNWDPPKISLETDIRECLFLGTNNTNNIFRMETKDADFIDGCIFAVLSSNETEQSQDVGHSHYYELDDDGNGFTHYIISSQQLAAEDFHYHPISNGVMGAIVGNYGSTSHYHTFSKTSTIANYENVIIRINKSVIGKSNYQIFVKNSVVFVVIKNTLISFKKGQFQSKIDLINQSTYLFKEENDNIADFVLNMMYDFKSSYQKEITYQPSVIGGTQVITVRSPFAFQTNDAGQNIEDGQNDYVISDPTPVNVWPTGNIGVPTIAISSQEDLFLQSIVVARNLVEDDNEAMFFPNVARFIPVQVLQKPQSEKVEIEILEKAEVTKMISSNNILFIDAENFKTGNFLPEYIPFLNHVENFSRDFSIYTFNTFSNDSAGFKITPILSSFDQDHYHKIWIDKYGDGQTSATYMNNTIVVAKTAEVTTDGSVEEKLVMVDHVHQIEKGIIKNVISSGLNQYEGNVEGTIHNHYVVNVPVNDSTSVFYVGDDKNGNIFMGTSNGFLSKPKNNGYEINIEGNIYCYESGNLYLSLLRAAYSNFLRTRRYAVFSSTYVSTAESSLTTLDASIDIPAIIVFSETEAKTISSEGEEDIIRNEKNKSFNITIKLVNIFTVSDFCKIVSPTSYETYNSEDQEVLWEIPIIAKDSGKITGYEIATETNFQNQTMWNGLILEDGSKFFVSQKKIIRSVVKEQQEYWEEIVIACNPFNIARKIIKSGDHLLVCGDNGVKKSNINNPTAFMDTSLNFDIYDIIQASSNAVFVTSQNGLYKTIDAGLNWVQFLSTTEIKEITRDYALDKTSVEDSHFHYLLTDINGNGYTSDAYLESGLPYLDEHFHKINDWQIQNILDHNHDIVSVLFFRTQNNEIFKSINSGETWSKTTDIPEQYDVETIFAAFGKLFVGTHNGLVYYENSVWKESEIEKRIFCFNWMYNLNGFYIGCDNNIYQSYDGTNIISCYAFGNYLLPICYANDIEIKNGFVYNNLSQFIYFKEELAVSDLVKVAQNYDLFLSQGYEQSDIWEYETFTVSTPVVETPTAEMTERKRQRLAAEAAARENQEPTYNYLNVAKNYETGSIVYVSSSITLPTPLTSETAYYAINVSSKTIKLAATLNNALQDININITSMGDGIHSIGQKQSSPSPEYDITIDDAIILSTKNDIDDRKSTGPNFDFDYTTGLIDFGIQSKIVANINYGDQEISVESTDGFQIGSGIVIYKLEPFTFGGLVSTAANVYEINKAGILIVKPQENICYYQKEIKRKISAISSGLLTLDSPIYDAITIDADIKQIYNLSEKPDIVATYYENAQITNIGTKNHEEIEDALSVRSIDMPFKLSEVMINNFNQLSLYIKYAIPDIDNTLQNWKSFFMRYDTDPDDENYIGNFFDLNASNAQNSSIVTGVFNPLLSSSINKVYFGRYDYQQMVFIGTNSGLFAGIPSNNLNNNWFLVPTNMFGRVYDVINIDNFQTLVLGSNGCFINKNSQMTEWQSFSSIVQNSAFFVRYRWANFDQTKYKDWWAQWNYDKNTKDEDLTNSLVLGGKNFILLSNNNGKSWSVSTVKVNDIDFASYDANAFLPLSTGPAILVLNNASQPNSLIAQDRLLKSSILETTGIGDSWDSEIYYFPLYNLVVEKVEVTDENNTKITFNKNNKDFMPFMPQNSLVGLPVFIKNQSTSIVSTSSDDIILRGSNVSSYISPYDTVRINPIKISSMAETREGSLILGTECGLFYDKNSYMDKNKAVGIITGVGKEAVVLSVDIGGFITSVSEGTTFAETVASSEGIDQTLTSNILCVLDKNVNTNELVGQNFLFLEEIVPKITILFPLPNLTIYSSTININLQVSVFDIQSSGFIAMQLDDGGIQYFSNVNFTISNLAYGKHKLKVFLTDTNKNPISGYFAEKTIYFNNASDSQTPYIDIEYPENNEIIKAAAFYAKIKIYNFNTFFEGSLAYQIDQGDRVVVGYQNNNTYSILFNQLSIATHTVKFMLLDTNNVENGISQTVNFTLSNDYPSVFIIVPAESSLITTKDINLKYEISNFNVPSNGSVKITANDKIYYSTDPLSYQLTGLIEGNNTIKVQLVDNELNNISGDFTSNSVTVTVATSLQGTPSISIFNPENGAIIKTNESTPIYFTVVNFDIPLEGGILVYLNGVLKDFWTSNDPYMLIVPSEGTYTLNAILAKTAEEKLNNSQASAKITLTATKLLDTDTTSTAATTTESTATESVTITPIATTSTTATAESQNEENYFSKVANSFRVISNSASSASGMTVIEINGDIDQTYKNMYFKIVGDSSCLFVAYVQPVEDHEFDGGKIYVKGDQENNAYNIYNIISQINDKIIIKESISAVNQSNELLDVEPKQTIMLTSSNNEKILFMNLDKNYGNNEFVNSMVYFEGFPDIKVRVNNNTQRSIVLNTNADISWVENGSSLYLSSVIFSPLYTFNNQKTTIDNDHYHVVELINSFLTGRIESIDKIQQGFITVHVKDTVGFDNQIVIDYPDLLEGATATFYASSNSAVTYYDTISSIDAVHNTIIIKTEDESNWNIDGFKTFGIDATFAFEINAKYYGKTTTTHYDDFYIYKTDITQDSLIDGFLVYINDSSKFHVNDDVKIFNNKKQTFYSKISYIIDDHTLELTSSLDYSFLVDDDSCIVIFKTGNNSDAEFDDFNHEHLIKNCEVSLEKNINFDLVGYLQQHSHGLSSLVGSVNNIIKQNDNGRIIVSGTSSKIYYTDDSGIIWKELIDVKDYIDEDKFSNDIYVTSMDIDNEKDIIIGTNVGIIIRQGLDNPNAALLNYPFLEEWLPSSSSSSSISSSSSESSESTSSSPTSQSTSSSTNAHSTSSLTSSSSSI